MFCLVGVRPDGERVLIVKQSTRQGAELLKRLMLHASHFSQLRIEDGRECGGPHFAGFSATSILSTDEDCIRRRGNHSGRQHRGVCCLANNLGQTESERRGELGCTAAPEAAAAVWGRCG